jgi:phosphocarrier protein
MKEVIRTVRIVNRLGLHARAAAKLVHTASGFQAGIFLERNGEEVNAKSLLGILTLAGALGSYITIRAVGADAREAVEALAALIARKFDEEE